MKQDLGLYTSFIFYALWNVCTFQSAIPHRIGKAQSTTQLGQTRRPKLKSRIHVLAHSLFGHPILTIKGNPMCWTTFCWTKTNSQLDLCEEVGLLANNGLSRPFVHGLALVSMQKQMPHRCQLARANLRPSLICLGVVSPACALCVALVPQCAAPL